MVSPQHFRLVTLGVPLLVSAAGEAVRYRTRKHFALLLRLAIEPGRRFAREYLIDLLWGTAPTAHGAHSLAQALTVIRATIGRQHLLVQGTTVGLANGVVEVDALHLDDCTAEIGGRFLEGFDVRGARGFEQWKDATAAHLYPKIRDCLVRRMDAGRRIGDFESVEKHAQILENLDPLSEDALRGIMEARAWAGDRTNALKAFSRFENRLREELGVAPSADIARMAGLLRDGRRPTRRPKEGQPPPLEERRFEPETLIGREHEFSVLYDAWIDVRRQEPRVVVVTGDPGIGKTTLVNSFVSTCQMEGACVSRTQAYDAERDLPFAVLAELVRQLVLQRAIQATEPEALSELTRITPEIFTVYPGVAKPIDWAPEITPLRLADSFLKALSAAAEDNPVVLVVDDIHAADSASVAILHLVSRKLEKLRLLLILTARPSELRLTPSTAILGDTSITGLRAVELDALSPNSASALVSRVAAESLDRSGEPPTNRILEASAGNPLALELLTREWAAHGAQSLVKQLEFLDTHPAPRIGIPRAIRTVFDQLTRRLGSKIRATLDLAAVLGRRLGELWLYEAVDFPPGEVGAYLEQLLESGILREVHGQIEFRNELIRAQAYYAIAAPVRQQLHRRVAAALTHEPREGTAPQDLEVAWHLLRGGDYEAALSFGLRGAIRSIDAGAPHEAEQVLTILRTQTLEKENEKNVLLLLAKAWLEQSRATDALPILNSLHDEFPLTVREFAEVSLFRARAEYLHNRQSGQRHSQAAASALDAARSTQEPELIVRALLEQARAGSEVGDDVTVRCVLAEIDQLLKEPSYKHLPMAHYACAFCQAFLFQIRPAYEQITSAIERLKTSGRLVELSQAYTGLGVVCYFLCKPDESIAAFAAGLELAKKLGDDSRTSSILANLCTSLTMKGDYQQAIETGLAAIEFGKRSLTQPYLVAAYTNLVDAFCLTGRPELAAAHIDAARSWVQEDRSWYARVTLLCQEGAFALMTGNQELALRIGTEMENEMRGREGAMPFPGMAAKLHVYRVLHLQSPNEAYDLARKYKEAYRGLCPLLHLDALAAAAWTERVLTGTYSEEVVTQLLAGDLTRLPGKRAELIAQGFLEGALM